MDVVSYGPAIASAAGINLTSIRLVVDGLMMSSPGGLQLLRELTSALGRTRPEDASVLVVVQDGRTLAIDSTLEVRPLKRPPLGWWGRWRWFEADLPALVRREHADVLYSMSGMVTRSLTNTCGVVATVNNMLPFTSEMLQQLPVWGAARVKYALLRRAYVEGLALADTVVLHSRHALDVLGSESPCLTDKTAVVLTGVPPNVRLRDGDAVPLHPHDGRPYFFYLSTMQVYKNHPRLIDAYVQAVERCGARCPDLVIAGIPADRGYVNLVRKKIQRSGLGQRIRYIGALRSEEVPAWIHHARGNVFPSLCETNSIVQAEILGMHGIMACSDIPPMNEVAGDAALLFDPRDVDSIAAVLARLAQDSALCDQLRARAALRVRALSWDQCGTVIWEQALLAKQRFEVRKVRRSA